MNYDDLYETVKKRFGIVSHEFLFGPNLIQSKEHIWFYAWSSLSTVGLKPASLCHWKSSYRKNPKISDTRKFIVITLKVEQDGFSLGQHFFLLIDLREIFLRFWGVGAKKKLK